MRVFADKAAIATAARHPAAAWRLPRSAKRAARIPRWRSALTVPARRLEPLGYWEIHLMAGCPVAPRNLIVRQYGWGTLRAAIAAPVAELARWLASVGPE